MVAGSAGKKFMFGPCLYNPTAYGSKAREEFYVPRSQNQITITAPNLARSTGSITTIPPMNCSLFESAFCEMKAGYSVLAAGASHRSKKGTGFSQNLKFEGRNEFKGNFEERF